MKQNDVNWILSTWFQLGDDIEILEVNEIETISNFV